MKALPIALYGALTLAALQPAAALGPIVHTDILPGDGDLLAAGGKNLPATPPTECPSADDAQAGTPTPPSPCNSGSPDPMLEEIRREVEQCLGVPPGSNVVDCIVGTVIDQPGHCIKLSGCFVCYYSAPLNLMPDVWPQGNGIVVSFPGHISNGNLDNWVIYFSLAHCR